MSVMFPPPQIWGQVAPVPSVWGRVLSRPLVGQFLIAMICAFALRGWQFGNPAIQIDEQFYLVTAERMLHGAVPFVDIWDRKPVGIFLLYAAIRMFGGEGIVQYQIAATLFAGLTAFLIATMALRFANARGAALAGCAYLAWLLVFEGSGGQTPVFYNAFVAGAAWLVLHATAPEMARPKLLALGGAAMLLVGIALQIKYSVVFEGLFFGCALLWRWPRDAAGVRTVPLAAAVWIGCALLPTLATWSWYAAHGYNEAFVYANFLSIFDRAGWSIGTLVERLAKIAGLAFPLILCAWLEAVTVRADDGDQARRTRRFALAWLGAAVGGVLVFGTYFEHYFLPVLVPLSLVCAAMLGDRTAGIAVSVGGRVRLMPFAAFVAVTAGVCFALAVPKQLKSRGTRADITALAEAIDRVRTGCMLVFDGEPILYHLTDACMVTSRIFPNHLNDATEAGATGIDIQAELHRILTVERPDIIVASDRPDSHYNKATLRQLRIAIGRDYRQVYHRRIGYRERLIYKRLAAAR
ncbi:ArnT family glycosyltransferase [Sphingomonas sp. PB4P5]|uniref:ArnT family glycosyltransferase n=1 Tax=Parasphingomonas puruogangriensis TaxID=3096155 RepID=UPI002FCC4956